MNISKISESISAMWNQKFPLHEGWQTLIERELLGDSVLVEGRLLRDGRLMSNAAVVWERSVPYAELEDQVRLRLYANCGVAESNSVVSSADVAIDNRAETTVPEVVAEVVVAISDISVEQAAATQVNSSDLFAGSLPFARIEDVETAPMLDLGVITDEVAKPVEVVVETPMEAKPAVANDSGNESSKKRERATESDAANPALIRAGNLSRRNRGLPPLADGATKGQALAAIRGEDN